MMSSHVVSDIVFEQEITSTECHDLKILTHANEHDSMLSRRYFRKILA
jgi:hypothetical protein